MSDFEKLINAIKLRDVDQVRTLLEEGGELECGEAARHYYNNKTSSLLFRFLQCFGTDYRGYLGT